MAQSIDGGVVIVNTLSTKKQWGLSTVYGGKRTALGRKIRRAENRGTGSRSGK